MRLAAACLLLFASTSEPPDLSTVDPATLGVDLLKPRKDPGTGFVVAGVNATDAIRKTPSFNGRSIADLERDMRPGALSTKGFLGKDERLLDILAMDNRFVVEERKLSHPELARHLHLVGAIAVKHGLEKPFEFRYHGQTFRVAAQKFRATVDSPFDDGTKTNIAVTVHNVGADTSIAYSLLLPHLIERYGFYEGRGTPYRLEPQGVLDVFPFLTAKGER